jgi:D-alanyl-D-alanine carboxypeptidase (penicillin-binding protein 5/6)
MRKKGRSTVMKKLLRWLVVVWLLWVPPGAEADLTLSSRYYCLLDGDTGQVLLSAGAHEPRQVASTTKMLTAILTTEYIGDLEQMAVVSPHADRTAEYTIGLQAGQEVSLNELLKACLIKSANDTAVVLAEYVAGDERFFAELMSKKAFALGAVQTFFVNASGLPDERHLSTAYDLAVIGSHALRHPLISRLVATEEAEFKHPAYRETLTIRTTNGLLSSYPGANGIKTGTANLSGNCLVGSATRAGRTLIAVVLKSGNRVGDCIQLLNYGFERTVAVPLLASGEAVKILPLRQGEKEVLEVYPAHNLWADQGSEGPDIEKKLHLDYTPALPVKKGQILGRMDIFLDGFYWDSVPLAAGESIAAEPGTLRRLWRTLTD